MLIPGQSLHRPFDAERYKQCIDYISRYGSHFQHISFVYKWRGLQDAISTFKQLVTLLTASCILAFAFLPM